MRILHYFTRWGGRPFPFRKFVYIGCGLLNLIIVLLWIDSYDTHDWGLLCLLRLPFSDQETAIITSGGQIQIQFAPLNSSGSIWKGGAIDQRWDLGILEYEHWPLYVSPTAPPVGFVRAWKFPYWIICILGGLFFGSCVFLSRRLHFRSSKKSIKNGERVAWSQKVPWSCGGWARAFQRIGGDW
jgi:hypothetical protein